MNAGAPLVAVVGRPNVGKSTLVNRLIGRREAIVEETSGVTRDTKSFTAQWRERSFAVVDTGGLAPHPDELGTRIAEQAHKALAHADLILFVLDATTGAVEDDLRVAELLRHLDKPMLVVANKVDDVHQESLVPELYALGLGEVIPVSALHGRRSGDLLDAIVALLPAAGSSDGEEWASAAIVGRPNVGKSSLLNALLNETRAIVDPAPGTTRDPVDSYVEIDSGKTLRVIDTAGMRREVQIKDPLEYFSWLRSRSTLARVDAALLVVDAADGVSAFDQRLGEEIASSGRACVLVFNKWDLMTGDEEKRVSFEADAKRRLRFLPWAPVIRTSATTGRGVAKVLPALDNAIESHRTRLSTSVVNRVIAAAQERQPPPRARGRAVRVLYGVQAAVAPPKFVMFATGSLEDGYVRYLERSIRAEFPFAGSPLAISVRTRDKVEV